jgi:hypothetical protein
VNTDIDENPSQSPFTKGRGYSYMDAKKESLRGAQPLLGKLLLPLPLSRRGRDGVRVKIMI